MPIKFRCPNGHVLQARDEKVGKQMRCPACQQIVTVPKPSASQRPAATTAADTPHKQEKETRGPRASKPVSPANQPTKRPTPRPAPPPAGAKTSSAAQPAKPKSHPHRPPPLPKQRSASPSDKKAKGPPPLRHPDQTAVAKDDQPAEPASAKPVSAPRPATAVAPSKPKPTDSPIAKPTMPPRPIGGEEAAAAAAAQPRPLASPSVAQAWSIDPPPVQAPARGIRRWFSFEQGARGYLPDRGKVASVRWLALLLAAIAVIGALPARQYYYFAGAPAWAQVILLISFVQLLYILWMASLPDWSTVWVTMIVFAVTSALYGFGLAVTLLTPAGRGLPLSLHQVHRIAPAWCGAMVLFTFLGAFMCGRYSFKWYKTYVLTARE